MRQAVARPSAGARQGKKVLRVEQFSGPEDEFMTLRGEEEEQSWIISGTFVQVHLVHKLKAHKAA